MATQDGQLGPQQQQAVVVSVSNSMAQLGNMTQPQQQGIPSPSTSSSINMTSLHHPQQMSADWGQGRVQVIHPQPYLQQIYSSNGQQILVPSNIALHPGINNQQIQVIATGKPFHGGQMGPHMMSPTQGKPVQLQQSQAASFPGYTIPTSQNQTFIFSSMNVIGSQPNVLPVQSQANTVVTGQAKNPDSQKILEQRNGQQKGTNQQVIASSTNTQIQLPVQNGGQQMQISQWQLPQVWGGSIFIRGPAPTDGTTFIQHPPAIQPAQPTLAVPCLGQQGQPNAPGVGKALPPLSNILPSSPSPLRQPNSSGSNASTQTAMQVQANAAKQAKIRSKIVAGHTMVTQKQDAANQTNKVQLPSGPVHHISKQQNLATQSPAQGSTDHRSVTPDKNQMSKIQQQQQQQVMFQHQQAVLQHQQNQMGQLAQQQLLVHYQESPHMQNKNMIGLTVSNMPVVPNNQNLQMNTVSVQQPHPMMQMQHPFICGSLVGHLDPPPNSQDLLIVIDMQINQNDLISPQNSLQPPQNPINILGHPHHASPPPQPPLAAQHQHPQLTPLQLQHLQQSLQAQHLQLNQQNQQINQQPQLNQLPLQTHQVHHNNLTKQAQHAQHNQPTPQTQRDNQLTPQTQQDNQLTPQIQQDKQLTPQTRHDNQLTPQTQQDNQLTPQTQQDNQLTSQIQQNNQLTPQTQQDNQLTPQTHRDNQLTPQLQQEHQKIQLTQIQQQTSRQQLQIQPNQQQTAIKQNIGSDQSIASNLKTPIPSTFTSVQNPVTIKVENVQQPSTVMKAVADVSQETEMVTFLKPILVLNQEILNKEKQIHPAGTSSSVTADITRIMAGGHYSLAPSPSSEPKIISNNLSESADSNNTPSQEPETCVSSNTDIPLETTAVPEIPTTSANMAASSPETSIADSSPDGSQLLILDKRLPKAKVKPNVLTHVIEGFVIQEASEPFAVSRPVQEWVAVRAQASQERNREEQIPKSPAKKHCSTVNEGVLGVQHIVEEGTCYCGEPVKPSKKFCSFLCSRKSQPRKHLIPAISDSKLAKVDVINRNENNSDETTNSPVAVESLKNENGSNPEAAALKWNVEQVADFIKNIPGCAIYAEEFVLQEVDGEALILIKPEHLVMSMSIKLGPALKIVASIDMLRPDKALSGETPADEVSPSTSGKSLPVFPPAAKKRKFST